jgi:preprotein translocase subunit SecY
MTARTDSLTVRIAVTLAACAALFVLERIALPFVDPESMRRVFLLTGTKHLSPFALGLLPFVTAFVLVELAALIVPRWRPLRGDPVGRLRLVRAAWVLALALAAVQGWGVANYLQSVRDHVGEAVLPDGMGPALVVATTIVAGTAAAGWLAVLVTDRGLGNGFAILLALLTVEDLARSGLRRLVSAAPREPWSDASLLAVLSVVVVGGLVFGHAARRRAVAAPCVPLPTCSITVIQLPAGLLQLAWLVAGWLAIDLRKAWFMGAALPYLWVAVVVALAVPLARLFFPGPAVVASWERAGADAGAAKAALAAAHRWSIALVAFAAALPVLAAGLGAGEVPSDFDVIRVVALIAVLADLRGELRARGQPLAPVRVLHRVREVDPILRALSAAGIDAFARTRHFRALFHIFAPYAPVEILVPPGRGPEAEGICARVVAPADDGAPT